MAQGTALVTGASTGIGRATALHLDSLGWTVLAGVRKQADAEALGAAGSARLRPLILDVTDPARIEAAVAAVAETGDGGLGALVNNAGYVVSGPLEFVDLDDLRRQFEVNLVAQVAVTQPLIPALRKAGGRIVFTGSIGGRVPLPFVAPYQASKAALANVAGSLRQELRRWDIKVVIVEPGAVTTPIWGKGKEEAGRLRDRLSPEARELYAGAMRAAEVIPDRQNAAGMPPEDVARLIERVLTARNPKPRYLIGREAKILWALYRLLPHTLLDRIVAKQMSQTRR